MLMELHHLMPVRQVVTNPVWKLPPANSNVRQAHVHRHRMSMLGSSPYLGCIVVLTVRQAEFTLN